MKQFIVSVLCCFNVIAANAGPGDDIWDNIHYLSSEIAQLKTNISQLNTSSVNTLLSLQQLQNELETLRRSLEAKDNTVAQMTTELERLKNNQLKPHVIGEHYHGGIVFYVDSTGEHGLVASQIDCNEEGIEWRNGASGNKITNARADGIGAGETNTLLIIGQQTVDNQKGNFAALLAHHFKVTEDGLTPCTASSTSSSTCYGGWYLPSAYELQLMHLNLHQTGLASFAPEFYWSSTEINVANAWLINFANGQHHSSSKSNTIGHVRAVSRF